MRTKKFVILVFAEMQIYYECKSVYTLFGFESEEMRLKQIIAKDKNGNNVSWCSDLLNNTISFHQIYDISDIHDQT